MSGTRRLTTLAPLPTPAPLPPPRPLGDIETTLVSVAIGEPYETSLRRMNATAAAAGFNRTQLWRRDDFLADPLAQRHRGQLDSMHQGHAARKARHMVDRPFCGAFKAFALLRALERSREGDYVLWADASKYHDARYRDVDVRDAIAALSGARSPARPQRLAISAAYWASPWFRNRTQEPRRTTRSAYGVLHCHVGNCDQQLFLPNFYRSSVNMRTLGAYPELSGDDQAAISRMSRRPHIMNANILLENTPFNRELMRAWVQMAVARPAHFCASVTQEQGVFSILVMGAHLPVVNPCPYLRITGFNKCREPSATCMLAAC